MTRQLFGNTFVRLEADGTFGFVEGIPDDAEVLVCMKMTVPLLLPDNVLAFCAGCNATLQLRPAAAAVPIKICLACAPSWREATVQ